MAMCERPCLLAFTDLGPQKVKNIEEPVRPMP